MSQLDRVNLLMNNLRQHTAGLATRIEEMQKQLNDWQNVIDTFEKLRSQISEEVFLEAIERIPLPDGLEHLTPASDEAASNPPKAMSPKDVVKTAVEVLLMENRPLKRGELVERMEAHGASLSGKDKNKNLGTILWRHPNLFVSIENLGYWVKGKPIEGIYDPERDDEPFPKTTFVKSRS